MKQSGRTAVPKDVVATEARQLRAIWDRTPVEQRGTQTTFGEQFGVGTQSAVGQFLRGDSPLSLNAALGFAKGLNCDLADFSPRLAAEAARAADTIRPSGDEFALVRRVDVALSAGHGSLVYEEGTKTALSFRRDFLRAIGVSEASAVVVNVRGHSMEPTIRDGAVLLVSTTAKQVIDREIYAFRLDGELYVKRLRRAGDEVVAESDNPDRVSFPELRLSEKTSDMEIIGRALWAGARL